MNAPIDWHDRLHPELAERITAGAAAHFYSGRTAPALAFAAGCLIGWLLALAQ